MVAKKKEQPIDKAVQKILDKSNVKLNDWKTEVVNQKKIAVMTDQDKEWLAKTIYEASVDLIMKDVIKNSNVSNNNIQGSVR